MQYRREGNGSVGQHALGMVSPREMATFSDGHAGGGCPHENPGRVIRASDLNGLMVMASLARDCRSRLGVWQRIAVSG